MAQAVISFSSSSQYLASPETLYVLFFNLLLAKRKHPRLPVTSLGKF